MFLFIVYFDADDSCHELTFNIGQNGIGATAATTRTFSIKVICYTALNCSNHLLLLHSDDIIRMLENLMFSLEQNGENFMISLEIDLEWFGTHLI